MNYILHKLPEGFIVTSSEVIFDKDLQFSERQNIFSKGDVPYGDTRKVIAQQDQINFSALSEEEQKEIGWFDIKKEAISYLDSNNALIYGITRQRLHEKTYTAGFQKAQELLSDRRFTLEDIKKAIRYGFDVGFCSNSSNKVKNDLQSEESFISQPKSWKVEGILENDKFKITKIL